VFESLVKVGIFVYALFDRWYVSYMLLHEETLFFCKDLKTEPKKQVNTVCIMHVASIHCSTIVYSNMHWQLSQCLVMPCWVELSRVLDISVSRHAMLCWVESSVRYLSVSSCHVELSRVLNITVSRHAMMSWVKSSVSHGHTQVTPWWYTVHYSEFLSLHGLTQVITRVLITPWQYRSHYPEFLSPHGSTLVITPISCSLMAVHRSSPWVLVIACLYTGHHLEYSSPHGLHRSSSWVVVTAYLYTDHYFEFLSLYGRTQVLSPSTHHPMAVHRSLPLAETGTNLLTAMVGWHVGLFVESNHGLFV